MQIPYNPEKELQEFLTQQVVRLQVVQELDAAEGCTEVLEMHNDFLATKGQGFATGFLVGAQYAIQRKELLCIKYANIRAKDNEELHERFPDYKGG